MNMSKVSYFVVACVGASLAICGYFIIQQDSFFGAEPAHELRTEQSAHIDDKAKGNVNTEQKEPRGGRNANKPQEKELNEQPNKDKAYNKLNEESNNEIKASKEKQKDMRTDKKLNDDSDEKLSDKYSDKSQQQYEDYKMENKGKGDNNKEQKMDDENKDEQEAEEKLSSPPPGHLKKLGEHGSPLIIGHFEELDYELNGKDFYAHFLKKRKPVVLRGAVKKWPAFHTWANTTYLKEKYGNELFRVEFTKKFENAPPIQKVMPMKEFLDIYESKEVYLDSPFPQSRMKEDIILPSCLQCKELMSGIKSIHLLFSSGGTSSNFHFDGYENLLSVISGTKEVLLAHYNNIRYFGKNGEFFAGVVSPINPEAVDLIRFPHLTNVTFYKVLTSEVNCSKFYYENSS